MQRLQAEQLQAEHGLLGRQAASGESCRDNTSICSRHRQQQQQPRQQRSKTMQPHWDGRAD
jgi:hypothetical protein